MSVLKWLYTFLFSLLTLSGPLNYNNILNPIYPIILNVLGIRFFFRLHLITHSYVFKKKDLTHNCLHILAIVEELIFTNNLTKTERKRRF